MYLCGSPRILPKKVLSIVSSIPSLLTDNQQAERVGAEGLGVQEP